MSVTSHHGKTVREKAEIADEAMGPPDVAPVLNTPQITPPPTQRSIKTGATSSGWGAVAHPKNHVTKSGTLHGSEHTEPSTPHAPSLNKRSEFKGFDHGHAGAFESVKGFEHAVGGGALLGEDRAQRVEEDGLGGVAAAGGDVVEALGA